MSGHTKEFQEMGRVAFWQCRRIWSNPHEGNEARSWSEGWWQARGECVIVAHTNRLTDAIIRQYRPKDIEDWKPTVVRRTPCSDRAAASGW